MMMMRIIVVSSFEWYLCIRMMGISFKDDESTCLCKIDLPVGLNLLGWHFGWNPPLYREVVGGGG